jgi:hypothetical protein
MSIILLKTGNTNAIEKKCSLKIILKSKKDWLTLNPSLWGQGRKKIPLIIHWDRHSGVNYPLQEEV